MAYLKDCIVVDKNWLSERLVQYMEMEQYCDLKEEKRTFALRISELKDILNQSKPLSDIMNRTLSTHTDFTENDIKNYLNEIRL